ncbi:MAG: NPCBM/NEW2 domain-containing protein, partial [Planctomycetota bacterium]|nr:NPCBM/NEW2 domain-containing protein [Planctomycetota bacterium]
NRDVGRLPAYHVGLEIDARGARQLVIRLPGAPADRLQKLPYSAVDRISFASDRVLFLSTVEPKKAEQRPVIGQPTPYRRDLSASGGPITLAGRVYRRGLGVHSFCALEYTLGGEYRAFAAVIGLDDSSRGKGSVTFRVIADGKEIYKQAFEAGAKPRSVSLPLEEVNVLRLEVDHGSDNLDIGDLADWADARVTR